MGPVLPPRRAPAALAALAGGLVLYAAALLGLREDPLPLLLDATLGSALSLSAAALVWWRALSVPAQRRVLAPLAAGISATALGEAAADLLEVVRGSPPQPAVAVTASLVAVPCFLLAARQYLLARVRERHRAAWLDAAAGLLVLVAWLSLLAAPLQDLATRLSGGREALPLLVPAVDVVLLLELVGIAVWCGARSDARLWVLAASQAVCLAGDAGWVLRARAGTYASGDPVDVLWTASSVLAAAAVHVPVRSLPRIPVGVTRLLVPPAAVALLCAALLVAAAGSPGARLCSVLVAGALLLVAGRLVLAHRELVPLAEARRLSLTDELTGLGNRRALLGALEDLVRREEAGCLLLLDLERFTEVNDGLGHGAGDELLRSVAERLRSHARGGDVAVRLGGDEFALLLPRTQLGPARRVAEEVACDLARRHRLSAASLHVPAAAGLAALPAHAATAEGVLHCADVALRAARRVRAPVVVYEESLDRRSGDRLRILEELREVLAPGAAGGSLVLHFQPKIDLRTGAVAGAEALVRWQHPRLGLLDPTAFLAAAEQRGLMPSLTRQVLDSALQEVRRWQEEGLGVPVAVNLSASDVLDAALPGRVRGALEEHGVEPAALHLEITETVVLGDSGRARSVVGALAALGVRLSVDDYGSGYSSLSYLRDLAVHDLKLDRSFVADVARDARAAAIVHSTVDLAHSLGMGLVAEGVADEEGLRLLRSLGCDQSQSHLHSPPLPAGEFRRWLAEHRTVTAG